MRRSLVMLIVVLLQALFSLVVLRTVVDVMPVPPGAALTALATALLLLYVVLEWERIGERLKRLHGACGEMLRHVRIAWMLRRRRGDDARSAKPPEPTTPVIPVMIEPVRIASFRYVETGDVGSEMSIFRRLARALLLRLRLALLIFLPPDTGLPTASRETPLGR